MRHRLLQLQQPSAAAAAAAAAAAQRYSYQGASVAEWRQIFDYSLAVGREVSVDSANELWLVADTDFCKSRQLG